MSISNSINNDLKNAMKSHDKVALTVIRMIKTDLMNEKIKLGHDLSEDEELTVISREVKQHKESIDDFKKADRDDLVETQESEMKVLEKYAPKQLSQAEIDEVVSETINSVGASNMSDFGKVMGAVMPKVKGKADGSLVQKSVKNNLK
ncbi:MULTISPECIES: GatB/YqeY domain-containing protein [Apilactobacillus]|uniref:GatB/YqeY domain-containing protein n=2 Tax=Apilactobacillus TaxID=2767877 RepID=A0A9Q8IMI1_9LACO|nr:MULTISPECIES: GatB/YqeY domain-containing protein [Apilactobacillus]TPR13863.1 GatB/YqeY domain-containing protein [Apilactobacillus timberlakei]TPR15179.1 GatB/YqeY domain-containing protein [Apilactobacillus timberlakei]TPR17070.1 GatB/YqeY domain-containing protein [Apilactobacillus timberlakei]TPR17472.1 GatB/YqeY domain-containing protein [Apilactobacillus timberlakei]TPR20063.1 GatB/YqeY domain-containing protein [Apilactobacillus timberlakei]